LTSVAPRTARLTFRTLEPIHGMIYFTPDGPRVYGELGITDPRMMYFGSRSAALGAVPAELTMATFFNFNPVAIRAVVPAVWEIASPAELLAARLRAVDLSLRAAWGAEVAGPEVREAAGLARRAAERAGERPGGRPLFAAHAALPWPDEPHLVLWHAQTLLREFRGDGHVASLLIEGLDGIEALITHSATGEMHAEVLRVSRAWSTAEWAAGEQRLRDRGWLNASGSTLSDTGAQRRRAIETRTDELALFAYEAIGEQGCDRLRALATALTIKVLDSELGFPAMLAARYRQSIADLGPNSPS